MNAGVERAEARVGSLTVVHPAGERIGVGIVAVVVAVAVVVESAAADVADRIVAVADNAAELAIAVPVAC